MVLGLRRKTRRRTPVNPRRILEKIKKRDIEFIYPSKSTVQEWKDKVERMKHDVLPISMERVRLPHLSTEEARFWKKLLKIGNKEKILFPCVMSGEWAKLMEKAGGNVIALDFAKTALKKASKGSNIQGVLGVAQQLPFKSRRFHKVISFDPSPLYAPTPYGALPFLSEARRVLKPGGEMIFIFPKEVGDLQHIKNIRKFANLTGARIKIKTIKSLNFKVPHSPHETIKLDYAEPLYVVTIKGGNPKKALRLSKRLIQLRKKNRPF